MYYKIENKESVVYQKLKNLRETELQREKDNLAAIKEKTGLEWDKYLGQGDSNQSFCRAKIYSGFKFKEAEKVDPKIWKLHKEHEGIYIPNKKTKVGREMAEFLLNGIKSGLYTDVLNILGIEHIYGKIILPYMEIVGETILLYLDDKQEPADENVIEITKKEFNQILESNKQ